MQVTLGQIRAFITVAAAGNFTRAADALKLTPPALTNRIRHFEDALGLRLFDRHTRSVALTTLGKDLLPTFRRLCSDFDSAVTNARESASRAKDVVRLACLPSCAASILPHLMRDFSKRTPGVTFVVRDVIHSVITDLVRNNQVDFGIAVRDDNQSDLEWQTLLSDRLQVVCREDDPFSGTMGASASALAQRSLILMHRGSTVREMADEAFAHAGLTVVPTCEVTHVATAVALVHAGVGVAILPSTLEIGAKAGIRSRPIKDPGFTREIALVRRKGSALHSSAEAFFAAIAARRGNSQQRIKIAGELRTSSPQKRRRSKSRSGNTPIGKPAPPS